MTRYVVGSHYGSAPTINTHTFSHAALLLVERVVKWSFSYKSATSHFQLLTDVSTYLIAQNDLCRRLFVLCQISVRFELLHIKDTAKKKIKKTLRLTLIVTRYSPSIEVDAIYWRDRVRKTFILRTTDLPTRNNPFYEITSHFIFDTRSKIRWKREKESS